MLKYSLFRLTVKYEITPCTHKTFIKKILLFFFSYSIRISGKNVNFGDKKNQKNQFLQKQKSNQDTRH